MRNHLISVMLAVLASSTAAQSQEITTCRNPSGKAYFHFSGQLSKDASGWVDDKISDGVFTLTQGADGSVDILYVDIYKKPISTVADGGLVRVLRRSDTSVMIIVLYSSSTEIYTFFKEKDGGSRFTLFQGRSNAVISKSSLLQGNCDSIRFDLLK